MAYSTITQVRLKTGLAITDVADADITSHIAFADEEINQTSSQNYGNAVSVTEYYSLYLPKRVDDIVPNRILLNHYPVQSINYFVLLNTDNTAYTTLDTMNAIEIAAGTYLSADYYCDVLSGIVELHTKAFDFVPDRAKITYTYGYSTPPLIVSELSANLAGIRAWIEFLGGNYDRLNSYSLPEQNYNKGDFYDRGMKIIENLSKKAEDLFNQLVKKQRSQIAVTSGGYF